ncbi:MAG: FtsX-like permease family protein [Planctomycetota bacterium]|jgi:ABC-type antimicrobial peptide transport system permease subunit
MTLLKLVRRSLFFYWRTNLGVLLAVMVSTAVLAGALVVGDSVENSLRMMVNARLGETQLALTSGDRFFTSELANKLAGKLDVTAAPVLQLKGLITNSDGSERANRIEILGVDKRFYEISAAQNIFSSNEIPEIVLNEALAGKIGVGLGDEIVLRMEKPSLMPREIPLTPGTDLSLAFRLTVTAIAAEEQFGRFSLQSNQISPLNAFVPLGWLQKQINQTGKVNMLLVGPSEENELTVEAANDAIQKNWELADAGLQLRWLAARDVLELRSSRIFGVLTYFVNELRSGEKATPYSMVTAMSKSSSGNSVIPVDMEDDDIIINDWLAEDLDVKEGDLIEAYYYVVTNRRKLEERTSQFRVRSVVPIDEFTVDSELMPEFPGLAEADNCRDWEPGIPIDLDKIRDKDENYWDKFHGTPKAFISLESGRKIWSNRYGDLTAVRFSLEAERVDILTKEMLSRISAASLGLYFQAVRTSGIKASGEGTDFGQLFIGFSMFLIFAALVLLGLLFVFGVEKRSTQAGMLLAVGYRHEQIRRLFLIEGGILAIAGTVAGTIVGLLYTKAIIYGLTSLWRDAVSGSNIVFYVSPSTLLIAGLAGTTVSMAAVWLSLRKKLQRSPQQLLDENLQWQFFTSKAFSRIRLWFFIAAIAAACAIILLIAMGTGKSSAGAFFGAGALLLVGSIALVHGLLHITAGIGKKTVGTLSGLGLRNSTRRSGRSLAVVAILASGVFLVIAVGANKHDPLAHAESRGSGTGGFVLFGESSIGVLDNLNSVSGRKSHGLENEEFENVKIVQLRVHDGDDASCFNLNRAQQPRIIGVEPQQFGQREAFLFKKEVSSNDTSGWELLDLDLGGDVTAAIGDEATVRWALGKSIGDEIGYTDDKGQNFRLRIVGMLKNSILQGSLIIAESEFIKRFPSEEGHRMFVVDTAMEKSEKISGILSDRLQDFGLDMTTTRERLAAFSAVENTYLSIFQLLGSLGLVLGSIGLGMVVLRNVLDRRGELAMLRAVGFDKNALKSMVFYEHAGLLLCGLIFGIISALVALGPILKSPGAEVPYITLVLTIAAIAVSGLIWIRLATSIALSGDILNALRSE